MEDEQIHTEQDLIADTTPNETQMEDPEVRLPGIARHRTVLMNNINNRLEQKRQLTSKKGE